MRVCESMSVCVFRCDTIYKMRPHAALRLWGVFASLCLTHESASSVCVGCGSSQSVVRCRRSEWSCRTSQVQSLIPWGQDPRDPQQPQGSPPQVPPRILLRTFHRMGQPPEGPSLKGQNPCDSSGNVRGIRSCRRPAGKWSPGGCSPLGNRWPQGRG